MKEQDGFILFNTVEFREWLRQQDTQRHIDKVLIHHTWKPDYSDFKGDNHFALQTGMRNFHMHDRGWDDIGQHFSTFPDGTVMTGRSLQLNPACTKGANVNAICIENVGNFDTDHDPMAPMHREMILEAAAWCCERWDVPVDEDHVLYHHWFDLNTGLRTDGTGVTKTCPGSGFFGGNTVEDAVANFLPLVYLKIESLPRV